MSRGFRIESLEIEGFRAFNLPRKFKLGDARFILLIGPIGSGKSSVLKAIEYALYGSSYEITRLGPVRLKHEDVINDFKDMLNIELVLGGEHELRVVRSRKRGGVGKLRVYIDNRPVKGEAESFLRSCIVLGHEDFLREIVIHHLILRDIVEGGPVRRSVALDRLFGIEMLEQTYKSIPLTIVEKKIDELKMRIKEVDLELARIGSLYTPQELKSLEADIERLREKVSTIQQEYDYIENLLTKLEEARLKYGLLLERYSNLESQLEDIEKRLEEVEEVSTVELISDMEDVLENTISFLRDMLYEDIIKEIPRGDEISLSEKVLKSTSKALDVVSSIVRDLEFKLEDLVNERMEYKRRYDVLRSRKLDLESEIERLLHYRYEYMKLVKKYGIPDDIEKRIEQKESEFLRLNRKSRQLRNLWDLLKILIDRLRLEKKIECPVCGSKLVEDDLKKILERKDRLEKKELVDTITRMERIEKEIEKLREILDRIKELEEKVRKLEELELEREELERKTSKLNNILQHAEENIHIVRDKIGRAKHLEVRLQDLISKLSTYLERKELIEKQKELHSKLKSIKEELEKLKYEEDRYLKLKKKREELRRTLFENRVKLESMLKDYERTKKELEKAHYLFKNKELLEKKLRFLETLYKRLKSVRNLLRVVQADLRTRMLERIRSNMNKTFRQLYVHPDLVEVDIRAVEVAKRSIYEIYVRRSSDGEWVPIYSKLSDGQRLMIALSLLLSIYKLYPHNIDFILLDEPFANINGECRKSILKLLARTDSPQQVLIATQDETIISLIKKIIDKDKIIVYKLTYGGVEGPRVTRIH